MKAVPAERQVHAEGEAEAWAGVGETSAGPDDAFHMAWVRGLLAEAIGRVQAVCEAKGQREHFELFVGRYLGEGDAPLGWRELGDRFRLDEKAARGRAETVARHFRAVLRSMLIADLESEAAADEELVALLSLL